MFEVANFLAAGDQLQPLGNSSVRLVVKVAVVPQLETARIRPVSDEPDFLGSVKWAENFHADVAGLVVHQVRALAEGLFDLGGLAIGDDEFTESDKAAGSLGDIGPQRERGAAGAAGAAGLVKRTTTGGGCWSEGWSCHREIVQEWTGSSSVKVAPLPGPAL